MGRQQMANKDNILKIRIFIAAPYDADEERKCLESTIKELNQPGRIIAQEGVESEFVEWSRFLEPYMKKNQAIDVEELPLEEGDLFVGILRFRFDGPVTTGDGTGKNSSPKFGNDKEVFEYAYDAWKKTGRPHLLLYRSHRFFSPSTIDIDQIKHIQNFFDRFVNNYQHPPLYRVFNETVSLKKTLPNDIINHVKNFKKYRILANEVRTIEKKIPPGPASSKEPAQSDVIEAVFLRVDSLLHNPMLKDHSLEKVGWLLNHYRDFIEEIITRYQGFQIYGGVDGSIWAFWGDELHDRAVSAGIELISRQADFNKNKNANPFVENLKPRLAAHCGAINIGTPDQRSYLRFKNYINYLEKYHTPSGTFVVTDILYQGLGNHLKKSLKYERIYENDTTYSYAGSYEKMPVSNTEIENIYIKIRDYTETLLENIDISAASPGGAPDPSVLRRDVGRIYKNYEYLYRRASDYDIDWPVGYFNKLRENIKSFLRKEKLLYEKLADLPVKLRGVSNPALLSMRDFVGSTRIYSISNLDSLLKQLEKVPGKGIDLDTLLEENMREKIEMRENIAAFVNADDFHEETAFAEFFLNPRSKEKLKTFVENQYRDPLYEKLVFRFRRLADFVRIEDRNALEDQKIFPILTRDPQNGKYFKVVEQLLLKDSNPERSQVENLFDEQGIPRQDVMEMDIGIVLKCLLIDHTEPGVRQYVFNHIQFKDLWHIIAYFKTPLETIKEIAGHLFLLKDEDRMKVFFDLTLPRLDNDLFDPRFPGILAQIKSIIEIFYKFDFFIETGYFRRLNDLSLRIKEKIEDNEIGILEESRKQLEKEFTETGGSPTTQPKILTELPKAVQRKLARDGHYLEFFCTSTNKDVADEVYRYINYNNIGKFVSITAINGTLFNKLLRRDELFKLNTVIYAALCNPRCNMEFASRQVPRLNREDQKKLASNRNVNSDIRNYIKNKQRMMMR